MSHNEINVMVPVAQVVPVNGGTVPKLPPTKWQKMKTLIYSKETKKIFGRTGKEWSRLGLFYLIFCGVLFGMFAICMKVLFITIDPNEPKLKLGESLIGTNPGLGFRPIFFEDGALISYELGEPATMGKWVKLLDDFLEPYVKSHTQANFEKCSFTKKANSNSVCLTDLTNFGPCTAQNNYGYNSSSPCIFVKLNKIFGWIPAFYKEPNDEMPQDLRDVIVKLPEIEKEQVWISCNGEESSDSKNVEGFKYFPGRGFPGYFYPYRNIKNYLSPIIAVQIINPKPNIVIKIECRAWAKNIYYHRSKTNRQGSVHFELFIKTN